MRKRQKRSRILAGIIAAVLVGTMVITLIAAMTPQV